jgi:hypothetical protein
MRVLANILVVTSALFAWQASAHADAPLEQGQASSAADPAGRIALSDLLVSAPALAPAPLALFAPVLDLASGLEDDARVTNESTKSAPQTCGGIAAIPCPDDMVCVDDPSDSCDPKKGGADCSGICRRAPKHGCHDPKKTYVATDPAQCATIKFVCAEGSVYFSGPCGCGCVKK